jgi:hypothetical protein
MRWKPLTHTLRREATKRTFTTISAQSSKAQSQKHKEHNMTQDRTYFRMLSDSALAEAARYCDNDLALVLGERLSAALDVEEQLEELQILYDRLVAENNALLDNMAE